MSIEYDLTVKASYKTSSDKGKAFSKWWDESSHYLRRECTDSEAYDDKLIAILKEATPVILQEGRCDTLPVYDNNILTHTEEGVTHLRLYWEHKNKDDEFYTFIEYIKDFMTIEHLVLNACTLDGPVIEIKEGVEL